MRTINDHTALKPSLRTDHLTPIGVERIGTIADALSNPAILRLENLDTDILPPLEALIASKAAIDDDNANSYLPFFGHNELRKSATNLVTKLAGLSEGTYDWRTQCFISAGGLNGILNVLLACINPGDEVILTSPTYIGLINRVKLAGGIPKFIQLIRDKDTWRLDLDSISKVVSPKCRAFLMMSPSMPSGAVFTREEWNAIAESCISANAWMIYDAAMERLLFDGVPYLHPASLPRMAERTITVGSASKEYRMIGWRVGWIVCPLTIAEAIGRVTISNVVCPVGISQRAVWAAINSLNDGISAAVEEWKSRCNLLLQELKAFEIIKPEGGWSLLIDVKSLGLTGRQASEKLLRKGEIVATSMENWGDSGVERYLRFVYSNEPLSRLKSIGERVSCALNE